jgi:hypothetical protein
LPSMYWTGSISLLFTFTHHIVAGLRWASCLALVFRGRGKNLKYVNCLLPHRSQGLRIYETRKVGTTIWYLDRSLNYCLESTISRLLKYQRSVDVDALSK